MKMKKSKLIISVLVVLVTLCALLAVCTLSASAADSYDLWVNNTQVTAQNAADVLGDGTVSYDAATKTLTLSGANITEVHTSDIFTAGIYAEIADLTVKLVGENRITVPTHDGGMPDGTEVAVASTKNIEISGTGKLWSNTYTVTGAQDVVIKNCEISSDWICLSAAGDVTVEDATISGKAGLVSTGTGDITLKNTNVPDGGNYVGMYTETGDITIENCNVTIHGAAVEDESTVPIAVGEGGGTLTVKNSVLDLRGNMYGILAPTSAGVFENVSGKIEISGAAAYGMILGGTASMTGCDLEISCRATEDAACGICAMQDIGIEDSKLKIDVRATDESAVCIGGIESPNTNVDIWNSTLELTASGPNAAGFYANNVKLNHSITTVEATALATGKGFAAGIVAAQGRALVSGGVLEVLVTGPVEHEGPATVGILMGNAVLVPEFIEADVKLRGNMAICAAPDLTLYGRDYEIVASANINGSEPVEYNKENIATYKYLHIHPFYTVTFNANGGTGTMDAVENLYGTFTIPENGFTAPEGKQFKGWAYAADGEIISETGFDVHKDTILYAIWEDISATAPDTTPEENDPNHTHSYSEDWKQTADEHYKECACGAKQYKGAHIDSNANGSCDVCGYVITESNDGALGAGAIISIVIGSVAVVGIGGFALFWFVIKKKSFADLIAIFKK